MPLAPNTLPARAFQQARRTSRLLFHWRSSDLSLTPVAAEVPTFSRASGGGLVTDSRGYYRDVAQYQPRFGMIYDAATGLWATPALLLEDARTNSALGSCLFADGTYWTNNADFTLAAAASCIPGQAASKHTDAAGSHWRTQTVGVFVNAQTDCFSAVVENVDATTTDLVFWDNVTAAALGVARLTWATHAVALAAGTGTVGVRDLGGGRYLVWLACTGTAAGTGAAGNGRRVAIYPCSSGVAAKSCILHHAQMETANAFPSSPVVTVAGAVARAADALSYPFLAPPQAMTLYAKFVERGSARSSTSRRVVEVSAANPLVLMGQTSGSGVYNITNIDATAGQVMSSAAAAPAYGDTVELRGLLNADGSVQLGQALNNGAEAVAAASAALSLAAAWGTAVLYVNGPTAGFNAFQSVKVAPGVRTLADMRTAF